MALLQAIESGELLPGDAVDEKALADRFGISRTPVREALLTLGPQRLVRIVPRSSVHLHAPAAPELVSMLEALSELEAVVARLCAPRMDPAQRDRVQRLTKRRARRQRRATGTATRPRTGTFTTPSTRAAAIRSLSSRSAIEVAAGGLPAQGA